MNLGEDIDAETALAAGGAKLEKSVDDDVREVIEDDSTLRILAADRHRPVDLDDGILEDLEDAIGRLADREILRFLGHHRVAIFLDDARDHAIKTDDRVECCVRHAVVPRRDRASRQTERRVVCACVRTVAISKTAAIVPIRVRMSIFFLLRGA